ncbi:MAG: hypothetical protein AAFR33_03150 [Pseudomonadota bacterium]
MDFSKGCLAIALAASATTACTSGMSAVRESIASAPEWYQDRAKEVRGEGYPSIGRIPTLDAGERSDVSLTAGREDVLAAEELFRMDPRAVPPGLELETMLEWAKEAKSAMEVVANQPSEHLTDEEIAALKALFETPRAKS